MPLDKNQSRRDFLCLFPEAPPAMQDVHFRQSWAVMDLAPRVRRTTPFDAFILDPLAYEPSEIGRRVPQALKDSTGIGCQEGGLSAEKMGCRC